MRDAPGTPCSGQPGRFCPDYQQWQRDLLLGGQSLPANSGPRLARRPPDERDVCYCRGSGYASGVALPDLTRPTSTSETALQMAGWAGGGVLDPIELLEQVHMALYKSSTSMGECAANLGADEDGVASGGVWRRRRSSSPAAADLLATASTPLQCGSGTRTAYR
jgi:hypothetical protein